MGKRKRVDWEARACTCVVAKSMGKSERWGWQHSPQTGSPGQSGRGQGCLWGTAGPAHTAASHSQVKHGADAKTRWEV